jgi:allantoate deiminase
LRHPDEAAKQRLAQSLQATCDRIAAERGVSVRYELASDVLPMAMHDQVKHVLVEAVEAHGLPYKTMVSGAGHDSQVMATRVPTGMLFVPSVDGRSHSPAEYTSAEDAARGASVLATALHQLAYG